MQNLELSQIDINSTGFLLLPVLSLRSSPSAAAMLRNKKHSLDSPPIEAVRRSTHLSTYRRLQLYSIFGTPPKFRLPSRYHTRQRMNTSPTSIRTTRHWHIEISEVRTESLSSAAPGPKISHTNV